MRRGSAPLTIRCATRCASVLVLPDPAPGDDEQRHRRRACVFPDAVLDGPSLFGIELFEIARRSSARISLAWLVH